jgi:nitroimidazol reductase NimA-like FMN-containing flavoprotein (pyridoxamine 5'-phosphate oxidase superfamily)
MRRTDKEILDLDEQLVPLREAQYITLALCTGNEPYLVTVSHGFDEEANCLYFHCAQEGKKIDILEANPIVWGQALIDLGYQQGRCDHLYYTTQFKGRVTFLNDAATKIHALKVMVRHIETNPDDIIAKQVKPSSVAKVRIGKIDLENMSSKKAAEIITTL